MIKHIDTTEDIVEETQRESIINRPYNLAGSIKKVTSERFNITKEKITYTESTVVPAVIKLFMEALDNPIDIAIKYNACNRINISVDETTINIKDNGIGVSTGVDENGEHILYKAFCKYNTSSNYREMKGESKGVNGIGVKLCTTLSTNFTVTSEDRAGRLRIKVSENNLHHDIEDLPAKNSTGVEVSFQPDFNIFEGTKIDQEHIDRMYEYTLMQALTYPDIKFTFNRKAVSITPKQFMKLLDENHIIEETEDYFIGILPNDTGEFRQLSYVNGLEISKGGSHVNAPVEHVVRAMQEKLVRKYKTIKRTDIKSKLMFVMVAKNMKNIDWEGQTKNNITSTPGVIKEYLKETNLDKLALRVYKNSAILDSVVDYFKIKEEYQKKKDLKKVSKKVKVSSEKYLPSIGKNKYLLIAEGQSATAGLIKPLGRKESAFYSLKGKPLNSYSASTQKFTGNKELSELFSIITNEDFEYIIPATDQDLDGIHIRGLLIGFIQRYLPEYKNKIGLLNTPVIVIKKNRKPVRWYYSLKDDIKVGAGESSHYMKGLGSFKPTDLEAIIKKDGIEQMIVMLDFDEESDDYIGDWLGEDSAPRKKYITNNSFSIAKL